MLGSLYAARLQDASSEVTVLARGQRYSDLKEHGIVPEDFETGNTSVTKVKVIDKMPEEEFFDFCLVVVQKIQVEFSKNMDAWLRYHVALVGPLANAMYMAGGTNYKLATNPRIVKKGLQGMREAMRVLQANGFPVEPPALKMLFIIPDIILVPPARRLFGSKLLDIGGARHANNAREEMIKLSEELLALAAAVKMDTPVLNELHRYADPACRINHDD